MRFAGSGSNGTPRGSTQCRPWRRCRSLVQRHNLELCEATAISGRGGRFIERGNYVSVTHPYVKLLVRPLLTFPSNPKCRVIINLEIKAKSGKRAARGRARRSGATGRRPGLVPWPSAAYGVESRRRGAALGVRPCSGPAGGAAAPRPRRSSRPTSKHLWEKARARGLGVWTRRRRRRARTRAARAERKREAQDASSARRRGAPTS